MPCQEEQPGATAIRAPPGPDIAIRLPALAEPVTHPTSQLSAVSIGPLNKARIRRPHSRLAVMARAMVPARRSGEPDSPVAIIQRARTVSASALAVATGASATSTIAPPTHKSPRLVGSAGASL